MIGLILFYLLVTAQAATVTFESCSPRSDGFHDCSYAVNLKRSEFGQEINVTSITDGSKFYMPQQNLGVTVIESTLNVGEYYKSTSPKMVTAVYGTCSGMDGVFCEKLLLAAPMNLRSPAPSSCTRGQITGFIYPYVKAIYGAFALSVNSSACASGVSFVFPSTTLTDDRYDRTSTAVTASYSVIVHEGVSESYYTLASTSPSVDLDSAQFIVHPAIFVDSQQRKGYVEEGSYLLELYPRYWDQFSTLNNPLISAYVDCDDLARLQYLFATHAEVTCASNLVSSDVPIIDVVNMPRVTGAFVEMGLNSGLFNFQPDSAHDYELVIHRSGVFKTYSGKFAFISVAKDCDNGYVFLKFDYFGDETTIQLDVYVGNNDIGVLVPVVNGRNSHDIMGCSAQKICYHNDCIFLEYTTSHVSTSTTSTSGVYPTPVVVVVDHHTNDGSFLLLSVEISLVFLLISFIIIFF